MLNLMKRVRADGGTLRGLIDWWIDWWLVFNAQVTAKVISRRKHEPSNHKQKSQSLFTLNIDFRLKKILRKK